MKTYRLCAKGSEIADSTLEERKRRNGVDADVETN
jgi:hypothetical protein